MLTATGLVVLVVVKATFIIAASAAVTFGIGTGADISLLSLQKPPFKLLHGTFRWNDSYKWWKVWSVLQLEH
jgi:hypothetical protein